MPISATAPAADLLQRAIADHRAGDRLAAEAAYRRLLAEAPDHVQANLNLGVLMVQSGRALEALAHLKTALDAKPGDALHWFSYTRGLLAAGRILEAREVLDQAAQRGLMDSRFEPLLAELRRSPEATVRSLRDALAADPDNARLLDDLGGTLLALGRPREATECYCRAVAAAPDFADAHYHLGSVLSEHGEVAEGFAHYMHRARLVYGAGRRPSSDPPDPPHKRAHDLAQRDYLAGRGIQTDFHLAEGARLGGPAVNRSALGSDLVEAWLCGDPQMVVVDDFLTPLALEALRRYCAGSTVWRKTYPAGYLGAAPEDGFACPLLAQIVEEVQDVYRPILNGEPFRYLGAFKYDSDNCKGTNTHGDNAIVNLNLYITPDEANLDPDRGGMEIWDRAAADLGELRRYNADEDALQRMLARSGAASTIVPHRANRAVIFKSTQFHRTDRFTFKSDYLSRRVNVSLLFGRFGPDSGGEAA